MTSKNDFKDLEEKKALCEHGIAIRAKLEYVTRVIDEEVASLRILIDDPKFNKLSLNIVGDSIDMTDKLEVFNTDLKTNDFLEI